VKGETIKSKVLLGGVKGKRIDGWNVGIDESRDHGKLLDLASDLRMGRRETLPAATSGRCARARGNGREAEEHVWRDRTERIATVCPFSVGRTLFGAVVAFVHNRRYPNITQGFVVETMPRGGFYLYLTSSSHEFHEMIVDCSVDRPPSTPAAAF
jgi:hypothetical protein